MLLTDPQLNELSILWDFGPGGYERGPSELEITNAIKLIGCKWPDEEDRAEARRRALVARRTAPVSVALPAASTPSVPPRRAVPTGVEEWEARIKVMPWPEAKEVLARNRLSIIEEAPNPGIRTMRARNALYAALRRGVALK